MPPMMTMTKASMMALPAMPRDAVTSGRREHAAQCRQSAADAEDTGAHQIDIDTQSVDHLGVLAGGADQQTEPGAFEELPDGERDDGAGADQEQAIDRERLIEQEDDAGEYFRHLHLQRIDAPEQADEFAQHQGQAEGDHQEGAFVAPVEPAQQADFERRADALRR